jgi:hypothetical protein
MRNNKNIKRDILYQVETPVFVENVRLRYSSGNGFESPMPRIPPLYVMHGID